MFRMILLAVSVALTLTACAPGTSDNFLADRVSFSGGFQQAPGSSDARVLARLDKSQPSQQSAVGRQIAVTRGFTLRLPSSEVATIQQRHLAECAKLACIVLETRLDRLAEERMSARTSVRVAPDRFPALAAAIAAPPVEVTAQFERAEDRTSAILDVDKRLEVKTTLRDRLTAMLKDPGPKTVADLVAIEKELAQAQGDIEASTAQREFLRTITETVRVDISYDGNPALAGGYDFSPIKRAAGGIGQTLITSVASLIIFLAAAMPWLPLIVLLAWGVRWGLRHWRARRAMTSA